VLSKSSFAIFCLLFVINESKSKNECGAPDVFHVSRSDYGYDYDYDYDVHSPFNASTP